MKVLIINSVCGTGSTGRICTDIAKKLENDGNTIKIAYGRSKYVPDEYKKYAVRIGSAFSVKLHAIKTRFLDKHGLGSILSTKRFLKWADKYNPELLWLHNIHGYYINYKLLFKWIKSRPDMQVKWTLHDCWAFTGHCTHFTLEGCSKWQSECSHCTQKNLYPKSCFLDRAKQNFNQKRMAFTGVKNLTIITPSNWLANLVKKSFLQEYPIKVIHNKINTDIFKPTSSSFKKNHCIDDKKMILGVANDWGKRKGLDDFIRLSTMLDNNYIIVLVGIDNSQIKDLPNNILTIERTNNPKELAEIYTVADVFVNLTYEDNYPTVNLEAQACGTPVFTYDTGGCSETIYTNDSKIVKTGDLSKIRDYILTI